MTSKHRITCIAISAAVALKLVAGTTEAAIANVGDTDARKGRVLLTVLHDASGRLDGAEYYAGRFIFNQAGLPTGRPIIVTDISNPTTQTQLGRGLDIARVDGEIVSPSSAAQSFPPSRLTSMLVNS